MIKSIYVENIYESEKNKEPKIINLLKLNDVLLKVPLWKIKLKYFY
jgi:hypothetical protein